MTLAWRGRMQTGFSTALVALAAFVLVATGAFAYHTENPARKTVEPAITENITLEVNNWTAYVFNLGAGDTITYTIQVVTGGNIDVYFVPPDGLADYASETALSFRLYRDIENSRQIAGSFGDATGSISVIVDNVDFSGATPTGPVDVQVALAKQSNLLAAAAGFIICGVIVIVIVIVLFVILRRRRKPAAMMPPAPMPYQPGAPGQYPYGQAPPPPAQPPMEPGQWPPPPQQP